MKKFLYVVIGLFLLWLVWPRIERPLAHAAFGVGHAAGSVSSAVTRLRNGPPPPEDTGVHVLRSIPLRITFVSDPPIRNIYGVHIGGPVWGGEFGIRRETPTLSGRVIARGVRALPDGTWAPGATRSHDAALTRQTCALTCTWNVVVEFADNVTHLEVSLDEHIHTLIARVVPVEGQVEPAEHEGDVWRPLIISGLLIANGNPLADYSHIPMRGGQLSIEQTGGINEATP
jgi:hypothetical protein